MKERFTRRVLSITVVAFVLALASCHTSRKSIGIEEGWELLSEQKVNFVRDKDEIVLNNHTLTLQCVLKLRIRIYISTT